MFYHKLQILAGRKTFKAHNINFIRALNPVIILRVGKRQRQHTLLLQIRLMDTRKAPHDDSQPAEETGFERRVLTGRALSVVVVADDDPLDPCVAVLCGDLWNGAPGAVKLALHLVGFAVLGVDGSDEAVFWERKQSIKSGEGPDNEALRTGDVREMTTVLQPRSTGRYVVSC